jgi:hypothetical protein
LLFDGTGGTAGRRTPPRYVVVFLDHALGKTGIALHRPPTP